MILNPLNKQDRIFWQTYKDSFDSNWIAYFFKTELERLMLKEEYMEAL